MTVDSTWAERALHHATHIAMRIGPRGAATPEEKRAADYAHKQMQQLGLSQARLESFTAPAYGWLVIAIAFSVAVWSVFICWGAYQLTQVRLIGGVFGAILSAFALIVIYLEATLRDNPIRRLVTRSRSHNAIGRQSPAESIQNRVVLVSNLDTPPAARPLKTPRRARLFRGIIIAGALSLLASIGLYLLGGLNVWGWAFVGAGLCGLLQSLMIFQALQADHGDFTPGANNNASGVGVVLALAERIKGEPLRHTEVWFAHCGSHTTGSVGLRALLQQHGDELREAWFIGFEGVGVGERLIGIQREGWPGRSIHPALPNLLERTQRENPALPIESLTTARHTVVAAAVQRGLKSLCLSVYADANQLPYVYVLDDEVTHLAAESLEVALTAGWELLQQIDRGEVAASAG
jgi:hypothetical protein